jgi:serine/threonine-protein kinase SRPK3
MAFLLKRLFLALDLLYQECHMAHTDIKVANVLLSADSSVSTQFKKQELNESSPEKEVDGHLPLSQNGHVESLWLSCTV